MGPRALKNHGWSLFSFGSFSADLILREGVIETAGRWWGGGGWRERGEPCSEKEHKTRPHQADLQQGMSMIYIYWFARRVLTRRRAEPKAEERDIYRASGHVGPSAARFRFLTLW
jgi:hypothetical protein